MKNISLPIFFCTNTCRWPASIRVQLVSLLNACFPLEINTFVHSLTGRKHTFRKVDLNARRKHENSKKDQHAQIKFCVECGFSREDVVRRIQQVHGQNALSVWSIRHWFSAFENGRNQVDDLLRPGQLLWRNPAKIQHVNQIIQQDKRQTIRQIAQRANLSIGSTFRTVRKDLALKKKCAHWIPHHLTDAQKQRRVDHARAALCTLGRNGAVNRVICGDESWFYVWDPSSRRENCQWLASNAPTPAVPMREQSTQKVMLIIFFDHFGLVYRRFVPQGQGVNGQLYLQVLQELCDAIRRRRPQIWRGRCWGILHDGAPAHRCNPVQT